MQNIQTQTKLYKISANELSQMVRWKPISVEVHPSVTIDRNQIAKLDSAKAAPHFRMLIKLVAFFIIYFCVPVQEGLLVTTASRSDVEKIGWHVRRSEEKEEGSARNPQNFL